MTEVDLILEVHRRERRRAEALFEIVGGVIALITIGILYACGAIP